MVGIKRLCSIVFLMSLSIQVARAEDYTENVCAAFGIEKQMFTIWKTVAQSLRNNERPEGYAYTNLTLDTPDGKNLSGYKMETEPTNTQRTALLVLQGNAMMADSLAKHLAVFADGGMDVFIFDYRGYGKSTGIPRLKAIGLDIQTITNYLQNQSYDALKVYAMSIGGIFALSPHVDRTAFSTIVIDSTPGEFPFLAFCPDKYEPISNLPNDASNYVAISGGKDRTVDPDAVKSLLEEVKARGGREHQFPNLNHPFNEGHTKSKERLSYVLEALKGN